MKWTTEKRRVNDLLPYANNPRQMTEKQDKDLKESLRKFDLVEIPAINRDGIILAGHQRLRILRALGRGEEEIEVRIPNRQLTKKEVQEYNIRSNKNTGEWDFDKLANNFDVGELLEWGFSEKDLKIYNIIEDEAPGLSNEPAVSKSGEVYQLGRHRLMVGDSTKIEDVEKLMGGQKADLCYTDPPYGVSYEKKTREIANQRKDILPIKNDELGKDALKEIVFPAFQNIATVLKEGGCYYVSSPQGGELGLMMMMMMNAGIEAKHMIVWAKDAPVFSMGRLDYDYQHEPILYGWRGSHQHFGNGKYKSSLWNIPRPKDSKLHPTMKPTELIVNIINNSSKQDDIVLDLFGGSGSTLIACEQTNRICFMAEISPAYCDVIRKRYAKFIGKGDSWQMETPKI